MRGRVGRGMRVDEVDHRILVLNWVRRRGIVEKEEGGETQKKMSKRRAIVEGKHGTHHKVFLIWGAHVVKERSTNMYLKYGWKEVTTLGHYEGDFHFK